MTDNEILAQLLFQNISRTPEDYMQQYPARDLPQDARVTRFAPSPTGFLHIGGLFAALVSQRTAAVTNGVFYVRIEDTDKKREVEDGVSEIIRGLNAFGIKIGEGVTGFGQETGAYGPYQQSRRKEIYQAFAKRLVEQGMAYPCFCDADRLNHIRAEQESKNLNRGYYGEWAVCRNLTLEQIKEKIAQGMPYVLRLRSPGNPEKRIVFDDFIKGKIEMPENDQDVVLLKTDGIPTYHFAHAVDDTLMHTTHVVRGDEWIASVPLHIQLFRAIGAKPPKYAHISPIMKIDGEDGGKRKLSKRKDPEAAVTYYAEQGYPKEAVMEYLLSIANSNYEDWRKANPLEPWEKFPFNLKKMSVSGALFDLVKLNDVSKNVISVMPAEKVLEDTCAWAKEKDTQLYELLTADKAYAQEILTIDRNTKKPRKDIGKWNEVREYLSYFYDELFQPDYSLPENIDPSDAAKILESYLAVYSAQDDKDQWFARMKELCEPLGYTPNVKEYKKDPDAYKGHVGDLSAVIRIAVTGRKNTPDLHSIMKLLGEERARARLQRALSYYSGEKKDEWKN